MPAGYTQLDYVDGCGTTDYYPIASTSMELVFQGGQSTLGNSAGPNAGTDAYWPLGWDSKCQWYVFDGGFESYSLTTGGSYRNASYYAQSEFGAIGSSKRTFRTWGLGASLDTTLSWSSRGALIIGAGRERKTSSNDLVFTSRSIGGIRVYSCTVWEEDACVRHYIPCLSPDGTYGMYDMVNGKFIIFRKANPLTIQYTFDSVLLPPEFGGGSIIVRYATVSATSPVTSDVVLFLSYDSDSNPYSFTITRGGTTSNTITVPAPDLNGPVLLESYSLNREYDDFYYYQTPLQWVERPSLPF